MCVIDVQVNAALSDSFEGDSSRVLGLRYNLPFDIILISDNISRQQNQEIDSFIRWKMVNFIKVDFQERKGII